MDWMRSTTGTWFGTMTVGCWSSSPSRYGTWTKFRARHIPLPDGQGQVKLSIGQVDSDKFFFYIIYDLVLKKKTNFESRASEYFEKRRALKLSMLWFETKWRICNIPQSNFNELVPNLAIQFRRKKNGEAEKTRTTLNAEIPSAA